MTLAVGVDIGGTKVAAGVVDPAGRVLARALRPTPSRDVRLVEETIVEVVREGLLNQPVLAVDIGDHCRAVLSHYFYY